MNIKTPKPEQYPEFVDVDGKTDLSSLGEAQYVQHFVSVCNGDILLARQRIKEWRNMQPYRSTRWYFWDTVFCIARYVRPFILLLLLFNCAGKAGYDYKTEWWKDGCSHYYDGICWNKVYGGIKDAYEIELGSLVKVSPLPRMRAIRNKAYEIMLENPEDAPHAMIWLTYHRLSLDLQKTNDKKQLEPGTLRPRRSIQ